MWRCDEFYRWGSEALSNVAAEWLVFVPCIQVISGSNLSPRTGHTWKFIVFSFGSSKKNAGIVSHIRLLRLFLQFIVRSSPDRSILHTDGTVACIINEINICSEAIRLNNTHTVQDIRSNPLILTAVPIDISRSSCWQVMRNYVALWQNRQLYPPGEVSVRCATAVDMVAGKQPGDPRINNGSQRYTTCE